MRIQTQMNCVNKFYEFAANIVRIEKKVGSHAFLVLVQCFALA